MRDYIFDQSIRPASTCQVGNNTQDAGGNQIFIFNNTQDDMKLVALNLPPNFIDGFIIRQRVIHLMQVPV